MGGAEQLIVAKNIVALPTIQRGRCDEDRFAPLILRLDAVLILPRSAGSTSAARLAIMLSRGAALDDRIVARSRAVHWRVIHNRIMARTRTMDGIMVDDRIVAGACTVQIAGGGTTEACKYQPARHQRGLGQRLVKIFRQRFLHFSAEGPPRR